MPFRSPLRRYERRPIRLPACVRRRLQVADDRPATTGDRSAPTSDTPLPTSAGLRDLRDEPQRALARGDALLAHLPDGTPVYGVLDTDGSPLYVYTETAAWYASADASGALGLILRPPGPPVELALNPVTRWHLRTFLGINTLDWLLVYANLWQRLGLLPRER